MAEARDNMSVDRVYRSRSKKTKLNLLIAIKPSHNMTRTKWSGALKVVALQHMQRVNVLPMRQNAIYVEKCDIISVCVKCQEV